MDSCYFIAAFILFYCTCADGFRSSAVLALRLLTTPCPSEITDIYNTMLSFISVSFWTAHIISTFRLRVGVRVRVVLHFGTGNLNHIR